MKQFRKSTVSVRSRSVTPAKTSVETSSVASKKEPTISKKTTSMPTKASDKPIKDPIIDKGSTHKPKQTTKIMEDKKLDITKEFIKNPTKIINEEVTTVKSEVKVTSNENPIKEN